MRRMLYPEMFELEHLHWWFRAKHQVVMSLLGRFVPAGGKVADLGCGCGMMSMILQQAGYEAMGMDSSSEAIAFASQRGVNVLKGGLPSPIPFPQDIQFDAVIMLDVLEHLELDSASVKAAAGLLKPGGIMIATVPAYQWLYAKRDQDHQHYRRYAKRQFRQLFEIDELKIQLLSHYNFWLFPIAAAVRLTGKIIPPTRDDSDMHIPPAPLNSTLRAIMASERHLLGRITLPWGLSLICVAQRV